MPAEHAQEAVDFLWRVVVRRPDPQHTALVEQAERVLLDI